MYTLRTATKHDMLFLFCVSTIAMLPVREKRKPNLKVHLLKEFKKYERRFAPEHMQVIEYQGMDVGRLRIVRDNAEIYIGGIQLLPEYQQKGIGSVIFADLISESNEKQLPIRLEVSKYNESAQQFYKKRGFFRIEEKDRSYIMRRNPDTRD